MTHRPSHLWFAVPLTFTGTVALAVTLTIAPAPSPGHPKLVADPILLSGAEPTPIDAPPLPGQGIALLMGGSGVPVPPVELARAGFDNFLAPNGFADYAAERLFTPEGLQTIEGISKQLPFNQSVTQGVQIAETQIDKDIQGGHNVVIAGVSQSATINSFVLQDIQDGKLNGVDVSDGKLAFLNLGDPSNPNGGILERFNLPQDPTPTFPSLGLTFSGATPADTGIPDTIYTLEYDGFADFPRYPMNSLADLNAVAGLALVHPLYIQGLLAPGVGLTPAEIAAA
ncbi:MAG: PE-PPE domain-containing protein, partial [Mycobacterium sp.]